MMKLMVERPDGRSVATVAPRGRTCYEIHTEDESVRGTIQQVLQIASERGLSYHSYRRLKTDTGVRYERLGRWSMPGEGDFLQALADYLVNYDLFAYPQDATSS